MRVVGPGEPVGHVVDDVGEVGAGREVAKPQRVTLAAGEIDGVREHRVVGGDLEAAEREVVVAAGEDVLVEHDLRLVRSVAARAPAVDRVLRPFESTSGVLPGAVGDRRRFVGLLDPHLDLAEDALPQRRERRQRCIGVGVLGLEVRDDLGIVAVAEPVPVVVPLVAVRRQHVGDAASPGGVARAAVDSGPGIGGRA